jgi:endopolyphosphatase
VDGCADKHEPGYEHMEWLRIQLTILRERGIKAMLMGHVPPARTDSKASWDETCWQKYALIQQSFRDIIVGSLYGHMNIDHFMIQDFKDIKKSTRKGRMANGLTSQTLEVRESMFEDGEITVASAADYLLDLGNAWAKLPLPPKSKKSKSKSATDYIDAEEEHQASIWQWVMDKILISKKNKKGGKGDKGGKDGNGGPSKKKRYLEKIGGRFAERFSVAHVSPSVVPNYFPTLRVFEYNITGLENTIMMPVQSHPVDRTNPPTSQLPMEYSDFSDDEGWIQDVEAIVKMKERKNTHAAKTKKPKKYKFKIPPPPDKSAPPGPAYSPQTFTLKGYAQYFANLTHINNDFVAQSHSIGHEAHDNTTIFGLDIEDGQIEPQRWKEGKHKNHQGKKPKNKPHPKKFKFEVEYNTTHDKLFKLKDLTVRSYIDLARRIGRDKKRKKVLSVEEEEYEVGDITGSEDEDEEIGGDTNEDKDIETEKQKEGNKEGKKHKKKHSRKHKHDGPWYTFVRRAFVSTMDPHEIEEAFGQGEVVEETAEEIMEL